MSRLEVIPESPDSTQAGALIALMEGFKEYACPSCARKLCGHQVLLNIFLGFRDGPKCLHCLAVALGQEETNLANRAIRFLQRRECHRAAWAWADGEESLSGVQCLATKGLARAE